ncbi:hypothetical protein B484DRAFT_428363 [Ochromonadaceae sp. CCMP2298]|nr:hypothetical protein B484DRAFT_428363 [Ochromonadaceae sp. CCMP2298]
MATLSRENPYFDRVLLIARDGIVVSDLLPPDFEPSGPQRDKWPPQRSKFIKASAAVEQLLQKNFLDKELALVLDSGRAQSITGLSVHRSGWAPKAGKVQGRSTGDPAPMNTLFTKLEADLRFRWELGRILRGAAGIYVDDIVGECRREDLDSELATGKRLVESLLGPRTIEDDKTKTGRRIEVIGFTLDLDRQLLAISDRCVERALGGYMSIRVQAPVPVRTVMRLASWAVRYTKVCRFMAPFVRALYASIKGRHLHTSIVLSSAAAISVGMVQALLALTVVKERTFTRNFAAWKAIGAGWAIVAQFDASLGGIGVIWYLRSPVGTESLIGGVWLDIRHLGFGEDSRFQNVAEFLAIICAVRGLQKLREGWLMVNDRAPDRLILRGDSMSALSWAENSRFRSDIATNAAIVFIMLGISAEIHIQGTVHVPAEENGRADYLSRMHEKGKIREGFGQEYPDLVGMPIVEMGADKLIRLSRPDEGMGGVQDFMGLATHTKRITEAQVEKIQGYMAKSVTEGVSIEYGRGIEVWKEFLGAEYTEEASPGEFLERESDPSDKILHVILFMVWMEEEKGSSEEQRGRALTYLRHHIDVIGLRPTEFMNCDLLSKARRSAIRMRISNLAAPESKAQDHALRAKEVVAVIQRPGATAPMRLSAGPALQAYLQVERSKRPALRGRSRAALFPEVIQLEIKLLTTKTTRKVGLYKANTLLFRRETVLESDFIDDMLEWDLMARPADEDELFFARVHPQRKTVLKLRSRVVAKLVKEAAVACGLDPKRFSTKSFREAFASSAQAQGMTSVERNVRGGWTADSTVPDTFYAIVDSVGMLGRRGVGVAPQASVPSVGMLQRRGASAPAVEGQGQ